MSHVTIIISKAVVLGPTLEPVIHANVTYTPSDDLSPQEVGKTVARILRRLPELADAHADE